MSRTHIIPRPQTRLLAWVALPLFLWSLVGLAVFAAVGCVSAGYDSETTRDIEPARIIETTMPDGSKTITKIQPRRETTRRRANYTDNRAAGAMAGGMMGEFGGIGGILQQIPTGGIVGGIAGLLGLVGVAGKSMLNNAKMKGENAEWEAQQRAEKAASQARAAMLERERAEGRDIDGDGAIGPKT